MSGSFGVDLILAQVKQFLIISSMLDEIPGYQTVSRALARHLVIP